MVGLVERVPSIVSAVRGVAHELGFWVSALHMDMRRYYLPTQGTCQQVWCGRAGAVPAHRGACGSCPRAAGGPAHRAGARAEPGTCRRKRLRAPGRALRPAAECHLGLGQTYSGPCSSLGGNAATARAASMCALT